MRSGCWPAHDLRLFASIPALGRLPPFQTPLRASFCRSNAVCIHQGPPNPASSSESRFDRTARRLFSGRGTVLGGNSAKTKATLTVRSSSCDGREGSDAGGGSSSNSSSNPLKQTAESLKKAAESASVSAGMVESAAESVDAAAAEGGEETKTGLAQVVDSMKQQIAGTLSDGDSSCAAKSTDAGLVRLHRKCAG